MRICKLILPWALVLAVLPGSGCAAAQEQSDVAGDEFQEQDPRLDLKPASGPAGSAVAVEGFGFRGDCGVRIHLDTEVGEPLAAADVDRSGAFSARLVIPPQTAGGQHAVLVRGLRSTTAGCSAPSEARAQAVFVVTPGDETESLPSLMISSREARPGATVRVEGRGFCAAAECSAVTVLIDGQVGAGDIEVSAAGTFSAEARVPAIDTVGRLAVVAVQTLADESEIRAFGEIDVTTRPDVRPPPVQ